MDERLSCAAPLTKTPVQVASAATQQKKHALNGNGRNKYNSLAARIRIVEARLIAWSWQHPCSDQ
eukprot:11436244-Prorocentrum_lima.AAC.1